MYPDGYSYSQFCEYFKQYLDSKDVSLHIEQSPGDKMYVDFAGSKMQIADPYTGEIKDVEVFVAVLGYSGKTYVRACESQHKEDFLSCIVRALNYFGGVPKVLVPASGSISAGLRLRLYCSENSSFIQGELV